MSSNRPGRNDPCSCGSGRKYKTCCRGKELPEKMTHVGRLGLPDGYKGPRVVTFAFPGPNIHSLGLPMGNKTPPGKAYGGDIMKVPEIASSGLVKDDWMWCLHCERFFQVRDLEVVVLTDGEFWVSCAFDDCCGAGFDVDLYTWNSWAKQNRVPHWPGSDAKLEKGLCCPLYPDGGISA